MSEEEKINTCVSPGMAFQDVIFEQVQNGSYVVFNRLEGKFLVANDAWHSFQHEGTRYFPLGRLPWPAAHIPKNYESEEQLFNEVRQFFQEHLDISNESWFDIYASFVMASWRVEDFTVIPYLFFLGPLASGKTRALECFQRLCYRSIMAASISAATIFRALEQWHCCLLLDETEIYNREAMIEVLALLNSGYRRGQYALRIEKLKDQAPQIGFFDVFGFKVLAGTTELAATLQSRCIITKMSKAVRQIELFIDEEKAEELRNKLLMYRFKNLGKRIDEFSNAVSKFPSGSFQNARVIELFISLLHVAPSEETKQSLQQCMLQITQSRLDEEQASIEARIVDAIIKSTGKVKDEKLSIQAITDTFNEGLNEKEQVDNRFIGRKITVLGFQKCRLSGGPRGFYWDQKLVERLQIRYFPIYPKTTSLTSQTSLSMRMDEQRKSDVSDESDVELEHIGLEDLKAVYWSHGFYDKHTCAVCGYEKLTSWQGETFKGAKVWICDDCAQAYQKDTKVEP